MRNVKQYGVGVKDGLAQCIHTLRLQLEAGMRRANKDDPICALVTDLSNAFNELGRDRLFQMLLEEAEENGLWNSRLQDGQELPVPACLRPWFSIFLVKYSAVTTVRYFRHDGTYVDVACAAGVHQGCPFGSAAFSAALHVSLSIVMRAHPDVLTVAYMDNVTLTGTVTKAYAAFDDLCPSIKEDLQLRINLSESFVYIPCDSEDDGEHQSITQAYEAIMQQRRQAGKMVLPLQTRGMVILGTAMGNDSYVQQQHEKWMPKVQGQIDKLKDMTDNLMHARFLKMHLGAQLLSKLRTEMPIGGQFQDGAYGKVDRKLAVAFLERALHEGWSPDAEFGAHGVSTEMLIGSVQAPISEGGFDVGGLQLTREAHFHP